MSFVVQDLDEWKKRIKRVLISGPPGSRKTSSLSTWPRPIGILSYPGEKGTAAIPQGDDVSALVWATEGEVTNWADVIKEVKGATKQLLEKPGLKTFAGDGLHKLYAAFLAEATFGASARGDNFEPKLYGSAAVRFFQYLDWVMRSGVEYVVFTVWDGKEADDSDEKGGTKHVYPELPGQSAKRVVGEFSLTLAATANSAGKYIWVTRPTGKIWGAGVKAPKEIVEKIPAEVEQDWGKLEKLLLG